MLLKNHRLPFSLLLKIIIPILPFVIVYWILCSSSKASTPSVASSVFGQGDLFLFAELLILGVLVEFGDVEENSQGESANEQQIDKLKEKAYKRLQLCLTLGCSLGFLLGLICFAAYFFCLMGTVTGAFPIPLSNQQVADSSIAFSGASVLIYVGCLIIDIRLHTVRLRKKA